MAEIPSPSEQLAQIKQIEKKSLVVGEKVCPISSQWYHEWKQYCNSTEPEKATIEPFDNSKVIKDNRLDPNTIENLHYVLIHKESYDLLQKWYTGGPTIELEVIVNSKGKPVVATKIMTLKVVYKDEEKDIEVNRYMQFSKVHQTIRKLFEIPETVNTRLFDYFSRNLGSELPDEKYVENFPLINNEQILLDYQKDDSKSWYSDELNEAKEKEREKLASRTVTKSSKPSTSTQKTTSYYSRSYYGYRQDKLSDNNDNAGTVGFSNLGNTCFFNSGTQCLMHTVPFVSKFVLNDDWENELNLTNKIGMKGELAKAFAALAEKVWSGKYSSVSPTNLKHVIGRFRDTFSGYEQQDSHELIYAMLDGIHEDLNRCKERPIIDPVEGDGTNDDQTAVEAWKRYKIINNSIVVDIFDGLVRSRLICPNCHSTTVVFDPFRSIPMPIARPHTKKLKVVFVPFDFEESRVKLRVEVSAIENEDQDVNAIAGEAISKAVGRKVNVRLGTRLYAGYPYKWSAKEVVSSTATVYAFEVPEEENRVFAICSIEIKAKYSVYSKGATELAKLIGTPFVVDVTDLPDDFDEGEGKELFDKKVEEKIKSIWPAQNAQTSATSKESDHEQEEKVKEDEEQEEKVKEDEEQEEKVKEDEEQEEKAKEGEVKEDNNNNNNDQKEDNSKDVKSGGGDAEVDEEFIKAFKEKMDLTPPYGVKFLGSEKIHVAVKSMATSYYYSSTKSKDKLKTLCKGSDCIANAQATIALNSASNYSIPALVKNVSSIIDSSDGKSSSSSSHADAITLDSCFEYFQTPEVLDEKNQWYCPKCEQFVCAEKKLDVWQVPQILIIQLKRFYGSGYMARKLDYFVDFPEFLDMKKYVIGPQKNEKSLKYRLYAVSNQYGSLGGGHYTAEARVRDPKTPDKDDGWYDFDDSHVSSSDESRAHTAAAYVLFYERVDESE